MITNPTRQRSLRGHRPSRPTPRLANTQDHQAALAARLTPRDRWIIRMLHEHRVLTAHQIGDMAFPSYRSGRLRLRELYQWSVLDRFQPFISVGTTPMHYVLAPAGAAVLAAEDGLDIKQLGYRHDRAFGIAHSLRLAHTVGVNEWFAALVTTATHHTTPPPADQNAGQGAEQGESEPARLEAWWSETRCARHFGDLVKPDAYGRWSHHGQTVEFFLEYDFGTEPLGKLAGKLTGYAALAQATGISTPLLVWLPTARREATARRLLHQHWRTLDQPLAVPVATAAADHLDPTAPHPSPADPVWLPLHVTTATPRQPLHRIASCWPHLPAPTLGEQTGPPTTTTPPVSAAPTPMPPHPVRPAAARPGRAR